MGQWVLKDQIGCLRKSEMAEYGFTRDTHIGISEGLFPKLCCLCSDSSAIAMQRGESIGFGNVCMRGGM